MKTYSIKPTDIQKKWVIVDAADQTLGRLSTEIARVLMGKNKPNFVPYLDTGDNVIVVNASKVKLTGNKWSEKLYFHHTGYIGGIKRATAQDIRDTHPERLVEIAVKGMLPKNKMGRKLAGNLRVFADDKHRLEAQKPEAMPVRTAKA